MKKTIILFVLSIVIGCANEPPTMSAQNSELCRSILIDSDVPFNHEYDLRLSIEDAGNGVYNLVSVIDFHNGAFTASPLSHKDLTGIFKIELRDNDKLTMDDSFEEIPRSAAKMDQFGNMMNWVSERTTYKRTCRIHSQQDFKVSGMVSFTIEPTCTFEEIPFDIFYENGKLRVQQYPKLDKRSCSIPVLDVSMYNSPTINEKVAMENPYDLTLDVVKMDNSEHKWVIDIQPNGGSFYVSPHSVRDFKGKFRVEIPPNDILRLGQEFVETPRSREVIDPHPWVDGKVNWVTESTKYEYPLQFNTQQDFEIGGKIVFVIEPKCTLEEIPILFKYKNGVLTVEKRTC